MSGASATSRSNARPAARLRAAGGRFAVRALGAAGVLLLLSALTFDPKLYVNGDNVEYMRLAGRVLAEGALWGSRKFPPLFPLLLAPVQALFGPSLIAQKILVLLFYVACGPLLLRLAERVLPRGAAFAATIASLAIVPVLEFSHYVMSEIPYLAFTLAALIAGETLLEAPTDGGAGPGGLRARSWRGPAVLLALWAMAFYTRTAGAVLPAAFLLVALAPGRRRWWRRGFALAAILALPWVARSLLSGAGGDTYLDQVGRVNPYFPEQDALGVGSLLGRLRENGVRYLLFEIPRALVPLAYQSTYTPRLGAREPVAWFLALPLLALVAAGAWRSARRLPLTVATATLAVGLCLLWPPIWASVRFVVPILPLLALMLLVGVAEPERRLKRAPCGWALVAALVVLLGLGARNGVRYAQETRSYPGPWDAYFDGAAWARDHLPRGSLVVDRKPGLFGFVSGLPAVTFPRESDPDRMLGFFREKGARYIHVSTIPYDDLPRFLYPAIQRRPGHFEPVRGVMHPDSSWSLLVEFRPAGDATGLGPSLGAPDAGPP